MSVSERYSRSSVGSSIASTGSWLASTPIEPAAVRVETISTSSEKTSPSGVSTSAVNSVRAMISSAGRPAPRFEEKADVRPSETDRSVTSLLGRLDDLVDRALEEERALGHLVVLAVDDLLEAADRLLDFHVGARRARELFGHEERLRQEALDLAGALDRELVLVGELVDAEDRDDVLELLVAL